MKSGRRSEVHRSECFSIEFYAQMYEDGVSTVESCKLTTLKLTAFCHRPRSVYD